MITIGYSTRKENLDFTKHLKKMAGNPKVGIIEVVNDGVKSLTQCYNEIMEKSSNDIILYVHDDIIIETKQLVNKLIRIFENNPEYGIIGVAGTKYLSGDGKWWSDRSLMYGRVKHTHQGNTWLSEYSKSLNGKLEEVVAVDGVCFAVHKNRIVDKFDETVSGFHFYDISFSFSNHIKGVKVGVTTDLLINHKSIGETNDSWEENRVLFSEKYSEHLPKKLYDNFNNRKLRLLMFFEKKDGTYDKTVKLAKDLNKNGCITTLVGDFQSHEILKLKNSGLTLYHILEPPGFRRGNGQFKINTNQGEIVSEPNKLYKMGIINYDLVYSDNMDLTKQLSKLYPESKVVDIETKEYYLTEKEPTKLKDYFIEVFNNN
jgi:hypothetical protein